MYFTDDIVESAGFVFRGVFVAEGFSDLCADVVGFYEVGVSVSVAVGECFDGTILGGGVEHIAAAFEPVGKVFLEVLQFSVDWFGFA